MSHSNIKVPDYSPDHHKTIAMLRAELSYEMAQAERLRDEMRSLADRVVKGEEVYLCLENGETVHIEAAKDGPSDG